MIDPFEPPGALGERWQRMEREADEDVAAGCVRAYEDVDDLLACWPPSIDEIR